MGLQRLLGARWPQGFGAGLLIRLLNWVGKRLPAALDQIRASLLTPVLSLLCVGAVMVFFVNPPLGRFNLWLMELLEGMQGGSRLALGTVLGALMATDYGGPVNKAAYLTGTLALVDNQFDLMASVMLGGMVPPVGIAVSCLLFPRPLHRRRTPHGAPEPADGGFFRYRRRALLRLAGPAARGCPPVCWAAGWPGIWPCCFAAAARRPTAVFSSSPSSRTRWDSCWPGRRGRS